MGFRSNSRVISIIPRIERFPESEGGRLDSKSGDAWLGLAMYAMNDLMLS